MDFWEPWLTCLRLLVGTAGGRGPSCLAAIYIGVGAPGEAWRLLRGASPRRVRPNQPPVSSVADTKEDVTKDRCSPLHWVTGSARNHEWPNDVSEAYTENPVGRRGDSAPQSNSASLHISMQAATVSLLRKPTRRDRYG